MIHNSYLTKENITKIQKIFSSHKELPSVTLYDFFDWSFYEKANKKIQKKRFKIQRKPMYHSFEISPPPTQLTNFLNSDPCKDYFSSITKKKIKKIGGKMFSFSWKHYTLLHDTRIEKPGYDIIIDFTDSWDKNAGGEVVYVDGDGNYQFTTVSPNTVTITRRKKNIHKFLHYVNYLSNQKKRILFMGKITFL